MCFFGALMREERAAEVSGSGYWAVGFRVLGCGVLGFRGLEGYWFTAWGFPEQLMETVLPQGPRLAGPKKFTSYGLRFLGGFLVHVP